MMDTSKVTRVELIDHYFGDGRIAVFGPYPDLEVELSLQDDGRTLKVFVKERKK